MNYYDPKKIKIGDRLLVTIDSILTTSHDYIVLTDDKNHSSLFSINVQKYLPEKVEFKIGDIVKTIHTQEAKYTIDALYEDCIWLRYDQLPQLYVYDKQDVYLVD